MSPPPEVLGCAEALHLIRDALARSRADQGPAVSVAVADPTGELLAFARADGAPLRSVRIAIMKAYTSARFERSTQAVQETLAASGRPLSDYGDPLFSALAGGVPIVDGARVVGAVGVSGRSPQEDHVLAAAVATAASCAPE